MSTRLDGLVPMLVCDDVPTTRNFFVDVLDFTVQGRMDDVGHSGWAHLENGHAAIMLASPTYFLPTPRIDGRHHTAICYFYPKDVRRFREEVVSRGGQPTELEEGPYGMLEFELLSPSGHVLIFGQDIPHVPDDADGR